MDGDTVHDGDTSDDASTSATVRIATRLPVGLVAMREAYRQAEQSLLALRVSGASHEQIAQAAGSLRALSHPLGLTG